MYVLYVFHMIGTFSDVQNHMLYSLQFLLFTFNIVKKHIYLLRETFLISDVQRTIRVHILSSVFTVAILRN
jgi:hypothetical protein